MNLKNLVLKMRILSAIIFIGLTIGLITCLLCVYYENAYCKLADYKPTACKTIYRADKTMYTNGIINAYYVGELPDNFICYYHEKSRDLQVNLTATKHELISKINRTIPVLDIISITCAILLALALL